MEVKIPTAPYPPAEPARAIRSTSPASEALCSLCGGTGWRRAQEAEHDLYRRCECVQARIVAARLQMIPALFRKATFAGFRPRNVEQERAITLMKQFPEGKWYLAGPYGSGKTHLLYAQLHEMALVGRVLCFVRTTRELVEELKKMELNDKFVSPVMAAARASAPCHLFWDDMDKLKPSDFKAEVLFELVDALYRNQHGLTVTANYSLHDLVDRERIHPAIVRRLDDMCRVIQL